MKELNAIAQKEEEIKELKKQQTELDLRKLQDSTAYLDVLDKIKKAEKEIEQLKAEASILMRLGIKVPDIGEIIKSVDEVIKKDYAFYKDEREQSSKPQEPVSKITPIESVQLKSLEKLADNLTTVFNALNLSVASFFSILMQGEGVGQAFKSMLKQIAVSHSIS